jgi:predicted DNA-binding protein YlxM (UPF0122 family)
MAAISDDDFKRLIEMMNDGSSVSSAAKALNIRRESVYTQMSDDQRETFEYTQALHLYKYEDIKNIYHKPKAHKENL